LADKKKSAIATTDLFNLDLNLNSFYETAKQDKTLWQMARDLWGLRSPTMQTVFEALIDSILEQQISLRVATGLERKMIKEFGETPTLEGTTYYTYPTPNALAKADLEALTSCGFSHRKAEYIKEISRLVAGGKLDLEKFKNFGDTSEAVSELDAVRGMGPWTAELTVLRSMQNWDAIPTDDLGLRRVIGHYYCKGNKITATQALEIAEPWGKWRGLAAFYFVAAEIVGIEP
jgi:DNA-3-methyladenine glycosylase II